MNRRIDMSKNKSISRCPNCGSRNLQFEGYGSKGRKIYHCGECDEVFEIHDGQSNKDKRREIKRIPE